MSSNGLNQISDLSKCSCQGYNLDKLLQPNILILLAQRKLHGYLIIQELEKKNLFCGKGVDNTGVYRALRTLEDREMLGCEWTLNETGQAKKIYHITSKGLQCLEYWTETLESYKESIEQIINDAKELSKGENS